MNREAHPVRRKPGRRPHTRQDRSRTLDAPPHHPTSAEEKP
ncbi:hypothetical protein [Streptomyces viridochromogenes]|nr:hypothetical protein [Streptomyces viridochromogenes]